VYDECIDDHIDNDERRLRGKSIEDIAQLETLHGWKDIFYGMLKPSTYFIVNI